MWYSLVGSRQKRSTLLSNPLCEFSLRLELRLPEPSRLQADSSPELCFPSALEGTKVHSPRALPARYVPPSGFGYPLGGLLPSNPRRLCFTPTALLGFTLRSFPLSEGIRSFPNGSTHLPFSQAIPLRHEAEEYTARPRFLGANPPESPWRSDMCLARRALAAPLGFTLPGHAGEGLAGISPKLLSRA